MSNCHLLFKASIPQKFSLSRNPDEKGCRGYGVSMPYDLEAFRGSRHGQLSGGAELTKHRAMIKIHFFGALSSNRSISCATAAKQKASTAMTACRLRRSS